jgi:hypothetical protein
MLLSPFGTWTGSRKPLPSTSVIGRYRGWAPAGKDADPSQARAPAGKDGSPGHVEIHEDQRR